MIEFKARKGGQGGLFDVYMSTMPTMSTAQWHIIVKGRRCCNIYGLFSTAPGYFRDATGMPALRFVLERRQGESPAFDYMDMSF